VVVFVVVMKIISWNVRGLSGFEKIREVSQLMREKSSFILCIQETKLSIFNDLVCKSIWNDTNAFDWCVGRFRYAFGS